MVTLSNFCLWMKELGVSGQEEYSTKSALNLGKYSFIDTEIGREIENNSVRERGNDRVRNRE